MYPKKLLKFLFLNETYGMSSHRHYLWFIKWFNGLTFFAEK